VTSVSVCLSVGVSVRERISRTTRRNFTEFSVYVTSGRGSVFLRWRCSLFTSGFVDDVIFSDTGPSAGDAVGCKLKVNHHVAERICVVRVTREDSMFCVSLDPPTLCEIFARMRGVGLTKVCLLLSRVRPSQRSPSSLKQEPTTPETNTLKTLLTIGFCRHCSSLFYRVDDKFRATR